MYEAYVEMRLEVITDSLVRGDSLPLKVAPASLSVVSAPCDTVTDVHLFTTSKASRGSNSTQV